MTTMVQHISLRGYVNDPILVPMNTVNPATVRIASALADPARLAILAALLEGEATVSELAARLALPQPRASTHLARLRDVALVETAAMGRHRAYRVNAARVKPLLDALYATGPAAVARPSAQAGRERRRDTPLRRARTCYDHLAGVAGVGLLDTMRRRRWVEEHATDRPGYAVTATGERALRRRGVDLERARQSRRQFAAACLDWTERRPHLGGALGAEVLTALRAGGYVRRARAGRAISLVKPLDAWLKG
jgi:DNA-binding transcriptional ArsR family regulator